MPRARVNGVELHYDDHGSGQALIFIHGGYGGAASTAVTPLEPEVVGAMPADRVRTITYDRRNAGRSEYTLEHFTNVDVAEDAIGLLDHLGIASAIVVGSSAGGPIALQLVLTHPERVSALCLANTGSYLMSDGRPRSGQFRALVERARTEGDRAAFESRREALRKPPALSGPNAANPAAVRRSEAVAAALASMSDDELCRLSSGEIRNLEAAFDLDYSTRLGEIRVPTIVIHGTQDGTVPFAWGEALHAAIAGSEFVAVEGADHGIFGYEPARDALRRWVEGLLPVRA